MKRYLLFYGDQYYAMGGMDDFLKDFDTICSALRFLVHHIRDENIVKRCKEVKDLRWANIYDLHEKRFVWVWE